MIKTSRSRKTKILWCMWIILPLWALFSQLYSTAWLPVLVDQEQILLPLGLRRTGGRAEHGNGIGTPQDSLAALVIEGGGCTQEYRDYPVSVQDGVNELLAGFILREPPIPIDHEEPPSLPRDLCTKPPFQGSVSVEEKRRRPLFSAFMFSHEVDLLEARLFEGMGIVDRFFIGESRYTHRGHRKRKFATELLQTRLARFADVIEVVDLDECPEYLSTVLKYRNMNPRPIIIWPTQGMAQKCLGAAVRAYSLKHAPSAIVHTSDLDEIPFRSTMASIKSCRFDLPFPVGVYTTRNSVFKWCRTPAEHQIGSLLFNAVNMTNERRPKRKTARKIEGGVHMTYFGGSLVEYFKVSNHAEGGQMKPLGWLNDTYNPTLCEAKREDWFRRDELLCTSSHPDTVSRSWEKLSAVVRKELDPVIVEDGLPWVLSSNRKRYPCFFEEHQTCTQSYIDFML